MGSERKPTRVLYCDIDGTIRKGFDEIGRFVNKPSDVELFDGVRERLWRYKNAGYRIVAITNQGGIAMGLVSDQDVVDALERTDILCGKVFDAIKYCQHHPDAKDPHKAVCWCRKPKYGGLVEANMELRLAYNEEYPPHMALFVGDRPEDEQCAYDAGIKFMPAATWRETGEPETGELK